MRVRQLRQLFRQRHDPRKALSRPARHPLRRRALLELPRPRNRSRSRLLLPRRRPGRAQSALRAAARVIRPRQGTKRLSRNPRSPRNRPLRSNRSRMHALCLPAVNRRRPMIFPTPPLRRLRRRQRWLCRRRPSSASRSQVSERFATPERHRSRPQTTVRRSSRRRRHRCGEPRLLEMRPRRRREC